MLSSNQGRLQSQADNQGRTLQGLSRSLPSYRGHRHYQAPQSRPETHGLFGKFKTKVHITVNSFIGSSLTWLLTPTP